jgi:hypothetical protein
LTEADEVPERVIRTLLVPDLVSSTALVGMLGDARAAEVFQRHDQLARNLLSTHDGVEIDKTDGFLGVGRWGRATPPHRSHKPDHSASDRSRRPLDRKRVR